MVMRKRGCDWGCGTEEMIADSGVPVVRRSRRGRECPGGMTFLKNGCAAVTVAFFCRKNI